MKNRKQLRSNRGQRLSRSKRLSGVCAEIIEQRLLLSTYTVTTLSDAPLPPSGLLTLRQAVTDANTHLGSDTILFAPSLFPNSTQQTITLTQGQLNISDATSTTTITGPGASLLAINGNNASRIFNISTGTNLSLSNLTVTDGLVAPTIAGQSADGGAIFNAGALSLTSVTVSNSKAQGAVPPTQGFKQVSGSAFGGGIFSTGPLTLTNSTISGNTASGGVAPGTDQNGDVEGSASGGGIYTTAALTLTNSNIDGNSADGGNGLNVTGSNGFAGNASGGGIDAIAAVTISGGTISGNTAAGGSESQYTGDGIASGGAVYAASTLTITNTTLSQNSADGGSGGFPGDIGSDGANAYGGAIYVEGLLTLTGAVLDSNTAAGGYSGFDGNLPGAASGGAVYATSDQNISSSTLSGNTATGGSAGGDDSFNTPGGNAFGGAIDGDNNLTLSNSTISGNTAMAGAGGNDFSDSAEGTGAGGGIYESASPIVTVTQSTISGNSAIGGLAGYSGATGGEGRGGGISSTGSLLVSASTISGNSATGGNGVTNYAHVGNGGIGEGAGLSLSTNAALINDTIANNIATGGPAGRASDQGPGGTGGNAMGGGIFSSSTNLAIADCTVTANSSLPGLGGPTYDGYPAGAPGQASSGALQATSSQVVITNSILSADTAAGKFDDIDGSINSKSANNLIGVVGGGIFNGTNGNKVGIKNPMLSVLGNNGGPTHTMVPLPGSPAIDAGNNSLIPSGITTDQRGLPRIVGKSVDIGATEFQASIFGTVFDDSNGNGKQDPSESGVPGVTVYIDTTNSGTFKSGDPKATTNSSGNYSFTGLVAGTYLVRQILPTGDNQISPAFDFGNHVTLAAGQTVSAINFADQGPVIALNSVSGTLFNDANKNGKQDSNETGLSGWTVFGDLNNNGKLDPGEASTTTGPTGQFFLDGLVPGAYIFRVIPPSGWTQTFPTNNFGQHVTVSSSTAVNNINFGFAQNSSAASISGSVFNDANANGIQNSGELGLSGWTVYIDLTNSGTLQNADPTTTTDSTGDFSFNDLAAGTYILRVISPTGWSQTLPTKNFGQHITLASGQKVNAVLFGEKKG